MATTVKENSKITMRDIAKVFWRWQFTCEMSNSYERMQAIAFCFAMIPVLKKLYPNKEDFVEALQRHLVFFNTEGTIGSVIVGMTVALEEEKVASDGAMTGESIIALKSATMGPIAGIGDTITWGTVKPIMYTMAVLASADGSPIGWFMIFLFAIVAGIYSWALMLMGYRLGKNALSSMISSVWIDRIISGASILGLFIVGGLAASNVSLNLTGTYMSAGTEKTIQSVIDGIVPGLLPLALIMGLCYYFSKNKGNQKFGKVVVGLLVLGVLLALLGLV